MSHVKQMPLRLPFELYEDIKQAAKQKGLSLNQYCLYLFARHVPRSKDNASKLGENVLTFVQEAQTLQKNMQSSKSIQTKDSPSFSLKRKMKEIHG